MLIYQFHYNVHSSTPAGFGFPALTVSNAGGSPTYVTADAAIWFYIDSQVTSSAVPSSETTLKTSLSVL